MIVKFWGVRGSIPTPLTQEQIRGRIAAAVARIQPADLASPETREAFLGRLPPYVFGTVGGNTTCLSIRAKDAPFIIIDAGSGIRELAASLSRSGERIRDYHILFTHFHWDHLQGLPFFSPAGYRKGNRLFLYSANGDLQELLNIQMRPPFFPVTMDAMAAEKHFRKLPAEQPLRLGKVQVRWRSMRHPGGCIAYRLSHDGRSMIFATDTELSTDDFKRTADNRSFFEGTDLLVLDAQYTLGEAIEKYDWGHTSYSMAVDFAAEWNIKTLALFHHEPLYNDRKIFSMLNSAEWYRARLDKRHFRVILAMEGMAIEL
jgi:phosphoribosyl 1,2-cyclic phosphodiesterase